MRHPSNLVTCDNEGRQQAQRRQTQEEHGGKPHVRSIWLLLLIDCIARRQEEGETTGCLPGCTFRFAQQGSFRSSLTVPPRIGGRSVRRGRFRLLEAAQRRPVTFARIARRGKVAKLCRRSCSRDLRKAAFCATPQSDARRPRPAARRGPAQARPNSRTARRRPLPRPQSPIRARLSWRETPWSNAVGANMIQQCRCAGQDSAAGDGPAQRQQFCPRMPIHG